MKPNLRTAILFVVLGVAHARAVAPAGRFMPGDGFVTDTVTGLAWEEPISDASYTFDNAQAYCAGLMLGGNSGWRAPSPKEYATIVDETAAAMSPVVDPSVFPNTPTELFWTSKSQFNAAGFGAWAVDFSSGDTTTEAPLLSHRVRCVR